MFNGKKNFLNLHGIKSQASVDNIGTDKGMVEYGYSQLEPNHLSAQRTGQIYAQLPAEPSINILEQGQFVKYEYAARVTSDATTPDKGNIGLVTFGETTSEGVTHGPNTNDLEWMLVYNETKLYRENQADCEFAMKKDDYMARIYSPYSWVKTEDEYQTRYYNGNGDPNFHFNNHNKVENGVLNIYDDTDENIIASYPIEDVTAGPDIYEPNYNEDPFHLFGRYYPEKMPTGTTMVPRVYKTNIADIITANLIRADYDTLTIGTALYVGDYGILTTTKKETADAKGAVSGSMIWQVVRKYTMPDGQNGVKIMRIA